MYVGDFGSPRYVILPRATSGGLAETYHVLCERLRHADQQLAEVALLQLPARLAKTMLRITKNEPRSTASPAQPTIQLSQQELANMVGGTRERVNKCLAAWRRDGIVKMSEGTIMITNMPALQLISEQ